MQSQLKQLNNMELCHYDQGKNRLGMHHAISIPTSKPAASKGIPEQFCKSAGTVNRIGICPGSKPVINQGHLRNRNARRKKPETYLTHNPSNPMHTIHKTDEAIGFIPLPNDAGKPITVVGTDAIRDNFDETCLQQAVNSRMAPGVTDLILNPDGHAGYGAPVGCVMVSPTHI
jgi:hypothetical protein